MTVTSGGDAHEPVRCIQDLSLLRHAGGAQAGRLPAPGDGILDELEVPVVRPVLVGRPDGADPSLLTQIASQTTVLQLGTSNPAAQSAASGVWNTADKIVSVNQHGDNEAHSDQGHGDRCE